MELQTDKIQAHPRLIKIELCEGTARNPIIGLVPSLDVYKNDALVGTFQENNGRFMPANLDGTPLRLTLDQMDCVNAAWGLPPEANRRPRHIFMNVLEWEVAPLATALVVAKIF